MFVRNMVGYVCPPDGRAVGRGSRRNGGFLRRMTRSGRAPGRGPGGSGRRAGSGGSGRRAGSAWAAGRERIRAAGRERLPAQGQKGRGGGLL